jgi:flagellin
MRSKINGLDQATANANDAIGLIQTEEGALTETHSMLQRMTTLATQAANGTYNNTSRASIQKEMDELGNEIDRIANNTDYNGIKPLAADSNMNVGGENNDNKLNMTMQIGPTKGEVLDLKGQDMTLKGIFNDLDIPMNRPGTYWGGTGFSFSGIGGEHPRMKELLKDNRFDKTQAERELVNAVKEAAKKEGVAVPSSFFITIGNPTNDNWIIAEVHNSGSLFATATSTTDNAMLAALRDAYVALGGVQKCKGEIADNLDDGKEYIQVTASGVDYDDETSNANRVIAYIQYAIDHVSRYRAELGAKQNRLEHTINNLQVTSENTIAAESRIRDTDMAKEMAAYTKNNILSQAAQSMLAQANQSGQGVLSLLQ